MRRLPVALLLAVAATGATAQTPSPSGRVESVASAADSIVANRAEALVTLLNGSGDSAELFSPDLNAHVPPTQVRAVASSLRAALGAPVGVTALRPASRWRAEVSIGFQRGTVLMEVAVEPGEPHRITEWRITGQQRADDSLNAIGADFRNLPGHTAIGIYALGAGEPQPLLEVDADRAMPLASAFKLWVLAEAARQVNARQRRWADVVPLGPPSLPSGMTQQWPAASPVTLQTLATLMIAISDNGAADTLMHTLGRDAINRSASASGLSTPVLTTREAFVLKGDAELRARWTALAPPARAALLARDRARFDVTPLATGIFAEGPIATDTAEWFASPRATAALLNRLRMSGGETAQAILAINPGVAPATARRFAFVGFKGGSEPGVLTLNYLVRTRAGHWFAVAAAWHRPDGPVDEPRFAALLARALDLLAER